MSDDPRPVRDSLDVVREQLRRPPEVTGPLHDFDPQAEAADTRAAMRQRQWATVMPARFNWCRVDDADAPYADNATQLAEWAKAPAGRNLLLFGPTGTGKTCAAMAACHPLYLTGATVEFWPLVDLLDALRPNGDPYAMSGLRDQEVLIIDDLGAERATDWTAERLYALVNWRWMHEKPTVVTGNQTIEQMREALDERLWSRLVGNDAVVLRLSGEDRRREAK